MIHCTKCGGDTGTIDSRVLLLTNETYRLRRCKLCHKQFWTVEMEVEPSQDLYESVSQARKDARKNKEEK